MATYKGNRLSQNRKRTLQLVNAIREATGRKPLADLKKGIPQDPYSCPIASGMPKYAKDVTGDIIVTNKPAFEKITKALKGRKGISFRVLDDTLNDDSPYSTRRFIGEIDLPQYAKDFIKAFDHGMYPDLIKKGHEGDVDDSAFGI